MFCLYRFRGFGALVIVKGLYFISKMSEEVDNYLEVYRAFVENFLNSIDEKDQLPVKIAKYNIIKSELVGAVLDWTFQLLNQW